MNTPLLLIVWRRPLETKQVIDSIRSVCPQNIYIACDGPVTNNDESEKLVNKVKEVISREIDWDCKIERRYSDYNQGCKNGVSNAISWFFSNVNEGIIMEDDCVPKKEFFTYCTNLLEKYRHDERVWCISGNNNQNGIKRGDKSYFFSRYPDIWGWATWKRCWDEYDPGMKSWSYLRKSKILFEYFDNTKQWNYWRNIWDNLYFNNEPDTWDYQWAYTCMINSGLSCIPNTELIENIGFGNLATHTKVPILNKKKVMFFQKNNFLPIQHPDYVIRSKKADIHFEKTYLSGLTFFSIISIKLKISSILRKLIKIINLSKKDFD